MAITPLPLAPTRDDPANFSARGDALMTALPTFVTEANSLAAAMGSISAGTAFAIPYTFSTTITDADPGPGYLRLSNATQNLSTVIRIDLTGADGSTWTSIIDTFDDSTSTTKGQIRLVKLADATKWLAFNVTALASPSGYKNIIVTAVSSSSANPFADGDSLALLFTRTGDAGNTGDTGAAGASGSLVLLATLTPTAVANIDFLSTFSSTYDNYLIVANGIIPSAGDSLSFRFANAGVVDSGSNYYQISGSGGNASTAQTSGYLRAGSTFTSGGADFVATVRNVNATATQKSIQSDSVAQSNSTFRTQGIDATSYSAANAVSGMRLFWASGSNFTASGKIYVYGYTK